MWITLKLLLMWKRIINTKYNVSSIAGQIDVPDDGLQGCHLSEVYDKIVIDSMESEYQVQNCKDTEGARKVIAPRWMRDCAYMRTPTLTKLSRQNIFLVEVWNSTHCDSLEHPVLGIGVVIYLCLNNGNSGETDCKCVIYQDASRLGFEVLTCMRRISQGRQRLWCYPKSPFPS